MSNFTPSFTSAILPPSNGNQLWGLAERYLNVSTERYKASTRDGRIYSLIPIENSKQQWCMKALKVLSYCTIVFPLIALAFRDIHRSCYTFVLESSAKPDLVKHSKEEKNAITFQHANGSSVSVSITPLVVSTSGGVVSQLPHSGSTPTQLNAHDLKLRKTVVADHSAKIKAKRLINDKEARKEERIRQTKLKIEIAKRQTLSHDLLEKVKLYVDDPSKLQDVPRAPIGRTPVYLPKELPIVLKKSGFQEGLKRFSQMKQACEICEQNGYEALVIPKAIVYKNFIVESRLPITMHGTKQQIGLYIENRDRFTNAVKEFTGFLCQSDFDDITGSDDPYGTLSETPVGRYDNIALYLENQGKIGLVDLEGFTPECDKGQEDWCFFRCRTAVHLFPYHTDEIISVAKKFDPNIEVYRRELELERDESLKRFQVAYENHLKFIRKNGITLQNPTVFKRLGVPRTEQLKRAIEKKLRSEHESFSPEGCLGKDPDKTLACFNEKIFPQILDAVYTLINHSLQINLKHYDRKESVLSNPELLSIRTLQFNQDYVVYNEFVKSISSQLGILTLERFDLERILSLLLDTVFEELEKGGEIAYYNPSFGYSCYTTKCVFC